MASRQIGPSEHHVNGTGRIVARLGNTLRLPRGLASPEKALILDFRDALQPVRTAPHYSLAEFRRISGMGLGTGIRWQLPSGAASLRDLIAEPGAGPLFMG